MQENPRTTNSLPFLFAVYFSAPRLAFSSEKISQESLRFIFFSEFLFKVTNKPPMIRTNRNTV